MSNTAWLVQRLNRLADRVEETHLKTRAGIMRRLAEIAGRAGNGLSDREVSDLITAIEWLGEDALAHDRQEGSAR